MLGLKLPTDPRWVNLAEKSIEEILTDHAYCEQKAASTCISIIQAYPDKELVVEQLAPIVTEEWGHFRQVLAELKKRGLKLGLQRKDEYVNKIFERALHGGSREYRLVDRLLISALIEARSCERFRLLSINMEDDHLKDFYHHFMVSEAGHYRLFIDLAKHYGEEVYVKEKWQDWLDCEAEIIKSLDVRGDRMH